MKRHAVRNGFLVVISALSCGSAFADLSPMTLDYVCGRLRNSPAFAVACLAAGRGAYVDNLALAACDRMTTAQGTLDCVRAVVNKRYTTEDVYTCDALPDGSPTTSCFQNTGIRIGRNNREDDRRMPEQNLTPRFAYAAASDSTTRCFPTDNNGRVLSGSSPVANSYCGTFYAFAGASDSTTRCFPADNNGRVLSGSSPVDNRYCYSDGAAPHLPPVHEQPRQGHPPVIVEVPRAPELERYLIGERRQSFNKACIASIGNSPNQKANKDLGKAAENCPSNWSGPSQCAETAVIQSSVNGECYASVASKASGNLTEGQMHAVQQGCAESTVQCFGYRERQHR